MVDYSSVFFTAELIHTIVSYDRIARIVWGDVNAAIESVLPTSVEFHSNCGSILLSFRDMTTERRTHDRRTDAGKRRMQARRHGFRAGGARKIWRALSLFFDDYGAL